MEKVDSHTRSPTTHARTHTDARHCIKHSIQSIKGHLSEHACVQDSIDFNFAKATGHCIEGFLIYLFDLFQIHFLERILTPSPSPSPRPPSPLLSPILVTVHGRDVHGLGSQKSRLKKKASKSGPYRRDIQGGECCSPAPGCPLLCVCERAFPL